MGNRVTCVDIIPEKVERLRQGILPIYEPGLKEMVERNVQASRLHFTTSYAEGLADAEFIFIAVNTPTGANQGAADMSYVERAAQSIAESLDHYAVIINKSTVPVGSGDVVTRIVKKHLTRPDVHFSVVSNPEFLAEGSAMTDFQNPDRVVLGSSDSESANKVATLYLPLRAPIVITDLYTAEMIKYASNAFLATKISFINEIATVCERVGANVQMVAKGMGLDNRIGSKFLHAGPGFGGSCFPKDLAALVQTGERVGYPMQIASAAALVNEQQRGRMVEKITKTVGELKGKTFAMLGLSFKPNTNDLRDAPALAIAQELIKQGATLRVYDPVALEEACQTMSGLIPCKDAYEAAEGADALILMTEWNQFRTLDFERLKTALRQPIFFDLRNVYEPDRVAAFGLRHISVGRPSKLPS